MRQLNDFLGHGTFVENVRIEPLTPVFIDFDGIFHFGASTRKYSPRKNLSVRDHLKEEEDVDNVVLPHQELELDVQYCRFCFMNSPEMF